MTAPAAERSLRTAIKERSFAPAYYLFGEDDYLKGEALRDLVDAAVDAATRDFNLETVRGGDVTPAAPRSPLGTPPMMADRRVVVVRDAGALKKDARTAIETFLRRPAGDILLVLVSPSDAKDVRGLAGAAIAVEFKPLTGDRVPKWIAYYAQHEHGIRVTEAAADLLQDAVGTDLSQLRTELDKLASFAHAQANDGAAGAIDEHAVSAVVGVRPGETMGSLLDAIACKEATTALALIPSVLDQPKASAVT